MKKLKWGVLLFLIFVFVLSSWPSFLAFNQAEQVALERDVKRMSVALVNEDGGAAFNGEKLDFGSEFVRNIEKDSTHNWFIVSRGVAESGLEENLYNMMIVIPHDFTEKALSIDSDSPEKVQISYKINASESNEVRSEAKETANSILNDFNRRIIDVYFASVIGNLQDAQDNIQSIVEKEARYTNTYNQSVHSPLADYTSQFSVVQDHSQISKESFTNFKDILNMFEQNLYDGVSSNQKYVTNFNDMLKTHQDNHLYTLDVYDELNSLRKHMHNEDVLTQQRRMKEAKEDILKQFQMPEGESRPTILSRAHDVQVFFRDALGQVNKVETDLKKLKENLEEELQKAFENSFNQDLVFLDNIFKEPDKKVFEKIKSQIQAIPSLDEKEMKEIGFSDDTLIQLKNVMKITEKVRKDFDDIPASEGEVPLTNLIAEIKTKLNSEGIISTDSIKIPIKELEGKHATEFKVTEISEEFTISHLVLKVGEETIFNGRYDTPIPIPNDKKGKLDVTATLKLHSPTSDIDLLKPISWKWDLVEKYQTTQEIVEESSPIEGTQVKARNTADDEQPEEPPEQTDPPTKTIKETNTENNYASKVMVSLLKGGDGKYLNAAAKTVSSYNKLSSLYELYFGFDLNDSNLESKLKESIKDSATTNSLYYLFNRENVVHVLKDFIINNLQTSYIEAQLAAVENQITTYKSFINKASDNSDALNRIIKRTGERASVLNENVNTTLKNLEQWREDSQLLLAGQQQVLDNETEEMATIVGLDAEFKAFLEQSQALAEQAKSNLSSADHVYDTLETIDKQAKQIQESGAAIVNHANTLSKQLVEKLNNDQDFANNFVNVLANSRVGDRPNEDLYSFLSEPVKVKNDGIIMAGDALTPYFLVLICSIVALFTAYVISTYDERRFKKSSFEKEMTTMKRNFPLTAITASIGIVEGLVICIISGYLLQISQTKLMQWIGLVVLVMVTMLLIATYLLRQLKMIGMFVLLMVLSMYLLLTNALSGEGEGKFSTLKQISPLHHVEMMLAKFMQASGGYLQVVISLVGLLIVGLIANLYVIHRIKEEEVETSEGIAEAN